MRQSWWTTAPLGRDVTEMVREQIEYRGLLYQVTKRDLLLRYKQTIMGFAWSVFMPLLNTAIFSVIFTRVAPIDAGVPYPVFAYCGLWVWNFFSGALKFAVNSLTGNPNLVSKVYFPREIFPIASVIVSLVDFVAASVPLVAMMIYYKIPVGPALVCLPLIIAAQVLLTIALALLLAMWNLFYRDVKYLFEVVISVAMFATPVVYPAELLGGKLGMIVRLNPMTPIIEAYRSVILRAEWPDPWPLAAMAVFSCVLLAWTWLAFHRAEFEFAENL